MGVVRRFSDRAAAGRALAPLLADLTAAPRAVLGLPRSGLVTAAPVARALEAPLAVAWVRRLIAPREPGVVLGAVDLDGDVTLNTAAAGAEGLTTSFIAALATRAHARLREAWARSPGPDPASLLPGATAILVDDGMTTGLTLIAAIRWARRQLAERVVVAVPVVDSRIWSRIAEQADAAVAIGERDDGPIARSEVYDDFRSVGPQQIDKLLASWAAELSRKPVVEPSAAE
jgi:putative phosphoribosyl transferase